MPIIKSAKKRMEIAARNNARNKSERSELATTIKKFNAINILSFSWWGDCW